VVIGAAYAVVVGAAYVIVVAWGAKYEGMTAEGAASGINAGSNGATSTSGSAAAGAGAGAAFFFLVALFLDFLAEAAAAIPTQKHNSASKSAHAMTGMYDPDEPESTEPELAWEPEESPEVNESREPEVREFMDADESPLEPEDESHGVTVVVGATVTISFAAIFGAATSTALPSDSGSGVVTSNASGNCSCPSCSANTDANFLRQCELLLGRGCWRPWRYCRTRAAGSCQVKEADQDNNVK